MAFIFFSLALEDIDENTVYIIGGLVDESIQKVSIHFSLFIVEAFAPLLSYPEGLALSLHGNKKKSLFLEPPPAWRSLCSKQREAEPEVRVDMLGDVDTAILLLLFFLPG